MTDHAPDTRTISDRESEILQLELIKADLETRIANARLELFKSQGGQLGFQASSLPKQVGALMQLLNERKSKEEGTRQQDTTQKLVDTQKPTTINHPSTTVVDADTTISKLPKITKTAGLHAADQSSFLSLKISPARYRYLVEKQNLPPSSATLAQGPDCDSHPRWEHSPSKANEGIQSNQPGLMSNETRAQTPMPQQSSNERVKINTAIPEISGHQTQKDIRVMSHIPQPGQKALTASIEAARSATIHPQSVPFVYGNGLHLQDQRAATPHVPLPTQADMLQSKSIAAGPLPGRPDIGPHNNAFLHLAAIHGISPSPAPTPISQTGSPNHQSSSPPYPPIKDIGWGGLTKKPRKAGAEESAQKQDTATRQTAQNTIPQKRGSSVELVNERPVQRSRLGPDRVMTPPLSELNRSRKIYENYDDTEEAEEPPSSQDRTPAPRYKDGHQSNFQPTQKRSSKKAPVKRSHLHSNASEDLIPYTYSDEYIEPQSPPPRPIDPEVAIRQRRQQRAATRKAPGYYKQKSRNVLSPSERVILELRFCAQITKIIGSKICVSEAPLPYDQVPIFERLASRFKARSDEPMTEEHYRSEKDFAADVRRILDMYVMCGHCKGCPFLKTGNARVMCYRMRLQSIIDNRMRDLKDCLYACEVETEADDHQGRCRIIDEWFWEEDFEEESHWKGP